MVNVEYFDSKAKVLKTVNAEKVLFGDKKVAIILSDDPLELIDIPIYYICSIK